MGSSTGRDKRQATRNQNTGKVMEGVMTGGEISKKKEAELNKAANYGRGVNFAKTGDTSRIIANAPTGGEFFNDMKRGIFGGKADNPSFVKNQKNSSGGEVSKNQEKKQSKSYSQYTPKTTKVNGLIKDIAKTGITPIGMAMKAMMGKKKKSNGKSLLAKERQGYQDDPYSVPTLLGKNLGD